MLRVIDDVKQEKRDALYRGLEFVLTRAEEGNEEAIEIIKEIRDIDLTQKEEEYPICFWCGEEFFKVEKPEDKRFKWIVCDGCKAK